MAPKDGAGNRNAPAPSETGKEAIAEAAAAQKSLLRRYLAIGLIGLLGPILAVLVGVYIYLAGGRYVSTDNAYVKAAKIAVSSDAEFKKMCATGPPWILKNPIFMPTIKGISRLLYVSDLIVETIPVSKICSSRL